MADVMVLDSERHLDSSMSEEMEIVMDEKLVDLVQGTTYVGPILPVTDILSSQIKTMYSKVDYYPGF